MKTVFSFTWESAGESPPLDVRTSDGVIGRVEKSLADKSKTLSDQLGKVEEREAAYKARLEKQYAALDVKLNAFKATPAYLEQQIKMWTKSND